MRGSFGAPSVLLALFLGIGLHLALCSDSLGMTQEQRVQRKAKVRAAALSAVVGLSTAALTVPSMMLLGSELGRQSSDLAAAAVPPLLLMAIVPPIAVTTTQWLMYRHLQPGARFHPAIWAAVSANLVCMVVGSVLGVYARDPLSLSLFTLADSLLMPASTALVLAGTQRTEPAPAGVSPLGAAQTAPVLSLSF